MTKNKNHAPETALSLFPMAESVRSVKSVLRGDVIDGPMEQLRNKTKGRKYNAALRHKKKR